MKKWISYAVILGVMMSICSINLFASRYYSDVPSDIWYREDLDFLDQDSRHIMNGYPDGSFHPLENLSVGQLLTCVVVASYYLDVKDVKTTGKWYEAFVAKAKALKYIEEGEFRSFDASISRGNTAKILVKAAENIRGEYVYRDVEMIKPLIKDYDRIPRNLKEYVVKAYDRGLMSGFPDGSFGATKILNRSQAISVLRRLIEEDKDGKPSLQAFDENGISIRTIENEVYRVNPQMPKELYYYAYGYNKENNTVETNKWLMKNRGMSQVLIWMNLAKSYMETFYNVDYRNYDKEKYAESLKPFFAEELTHYADDGIPRTRDGYIKNWVENVEKKQLVLKSEFITDPSLVYGRFYSVTRGKLLYKVESCNDMEWLKQYTNNFGYVDLGKQYSAILEIETVTLVLSQNSKEDPDFIHKEALVTGLMEVK